MIEVTPVKFDKNSIINQEEMATKIPSSAKESVFFPASVIFGFPPLSKKVNAPTINITNDDNPTAVTAMFNTFRTTHSSPESVGISYVAGPFPKSMVTC